MAAAGVALVKLFLKNFAVPFLKPTPLLHNIPTLWLHLAEQDFDMHVARVEGASNIADGPTREFLEHVGRLQAKFVAPVLPQWLDDVWRAA